MIKFSIITCTLNSASYIKDNIDSVISQNYKEFEHIFVDGYSSDETLKIINDYKNKFPSKVKIYFEEPTGISSAMNRGIKESSGDYLIHLHSDDSFFNKQVLSDTSLTLESKNFDWIYGQINVIDKNGTIGIFPKSSFWKTSSSNIIKNYLLKFYNYIPHQAVFIKKEVFERFNYFDDTLKSSMDLDFWLKIRKETRWRFFKVIVSNYYLHSNAQSSSLKNKNQNIKNYLIVQNRYLNFIDLFFARIFNYLLDLKNKNYR